MCMLSGLSKWELHRGCPIVHEEHEERSHENTMQSITQELFFRLTNSENVPVQTWDLSAASRYATIRRGKYASQAPRAAPTGGSGRTLWPATGGIPLSLPGVR